MLNSESEKRSNERLKTLHSRKRKYERLLSNPIKQKERDDSDNTQQERYKTLVENIPCVVYSAYPGKTGPTTFMSEKWKNWAQPQQDSKLGTVSGLHGFIQPAANVIFAFAEMRISATISKVQAVMQTAVTRNI